MKKSKRNIKLKARIRDTYFIRRGLALYVDLLLIGFLSMIFYLTLLFILSFFQPEYKKPVEDLKKTMSLKSSQEELSPLGEFVLEKTEKYLEKKISEANKILEENELKSEEKEKLKKEIEKGKKKLEEIRRRKIESKTEKGLEQKLEEELSILSYIEEKYKWLQEILIIYTYFTLFIYFRGQTPGKKLLGLKVVKRDGSKLSLWEAFERTHGYAYSASLLLIGFLQVLWDKHSLTMHDKIAGTEVIRVKKTKKKKLKRRRLKKK